jgi:hypothetical protein
MRGIRTLVTGSAAVGLLASAPAYADALTRIESTVRQGQAFGPLMNTCNATVSIWRANISGVNAVQGSMDSRTCSGKWTLILFRNRVQEPPVVTGSGKTPAYTTFRREGPKGTRYQACVYGLPEVCSGEYIVK